MKKSFSPKEYIFLSLILLLSSACRETVHWQAAVPEKGEVGAHVLPDTIAPVSAPFDFPDMEKSVFPDFAVSIADFGAVSGEKVTEAINRAIRDVHERGGGMVIVPSGIWLTGRIVLLSDVNLHLSEGAELHFSGVVADYQPAVFTRQEGVEVYSLGALVYADGQENIALTGKGKLVGPARDCEIQKRQMRGNVIENLIDASSPVESRVYDGRKDGGVFLPMFFSPIRCRQVYVEGVTFENTPFWNVVPVYCDGVVIRGITVRSEKIPRGDGIDIESSRNVLIEYCTLSCGDDCFTLKAGRCEDGLRVNRPTENIVIRYCLAQKGHGAITCGSETAGVIRNVYVHDCVFDGTDTGLRFKTRRNRGGGGENLLYERVRMSSCGQPFVWDMLGSRTYVGDLAVRLPAREMTPLTPFYRNIMARDIIVEQCNRLVKAVGIPEVPVSDVTIERIDAYCNQLMTLQDVDGMTFRDMIVYGSDSILALTDARRIRFDRVSFCLPGGKPAVRLDGELSVLPEYIDCRFSDTEISDGR